MSDRKLLVDSFSEEGGLLSRASSLAPISVYRVSFSNRNIPFSFNFFGLHSSSVEAVSSKRMKWQSLCQGDRRWRDSGGPLQHGIEAMSDPPLRRSREILRPW
jgi:hypothetical protein